MSSSIGDAFDENVVLLKDVIRHIQKQNPSCSSLDNIHSAKVCSIPGRRGIALGAAVTTTTNNGNNENNNNNMNSTSINNIFGIFQPSGGVFSEEFRIPGLLARRCFPLHIGNQATKKDYSPQQTSNVSEKELATRVTSAAIVETDAEEFVFIIMEENVETSDVVVRVKPMIWDDASDKKVIESALAKNELVLIAGTFPNHVVFVTTCGVLDFKATCEEMFEDDDIDHHNPATIVLRLTRHRHCRLSGEDDPEDVYLSGLEGIKNELPIKERHEMINSLYTLNHTLPMCDCSKCLENKQEQCAPQPEELVAVIAEAASSNRATIALWIGRSAHSKLAKLLILRTAVDADCASVGSDACTSRSVSRCSYFLEHANEWAYYCARLLRIRSRRGLGVASLAVETITMEVQPLEDPLPDKSRTELVEKIFVLLSGPEFPNEFEDEENNNNSNNSNNNADNEMKNPSTPTTLYYKPIGIMEIAMKRCSKWCRPRWAVLKRVAIMKESLKDIVDAKFPAFLAYMKRKEELLAHIASSGGQKPQHEEKEADSEFTNFDDCHPPSREEALKQLDNEIDSVFTPMNSPSTTCCGFCGSNDPNVISVVKGNKLNANAAASGATATVTLAEAVARRRSILLDSAVHPIIIARTVPAVSSLSPKRPTYNLVIVDTYFYDAQSKQLMVSSRPFPDREDTSYNPEFAKRIVRSGPSNMPFTCPNFTHPDFFVPCCGDATSVCAIDYSGNMSVATAYGIGVANFDFSKQDPIVLPMGIRTNNGSLPYFAEEVDDGDDGDNDEDVNNREKEEEENGKASILPPRRILRSVENYSHSYLWVCDAGGGVSLAKSEYADSMAHFDAARHGVNTTNLASNFTTTTTSVSTSNARSSIFSRICSIASLAQGRNIFVGHNENIRNQSQQQKQGNEMMPRMLTRTESDMNYNNGASSSMFFTPTEQFSADDSRTNNNNNTHNSGSPSSSSLPDSLFGIVSGELLRETLFSSSLLVNDKYGAVLIDFNNNTNAYNNNKCPQILSNIIPLRNNRPLCSLCLRLDEGASMMLFVAGCASGCVSFSLLTRSTTTTKKIKNKHDNKNANDTDDEERDDVSYVASNLAIRRENNNNNNNSNSAPSTVKPTAKSDGVFSEEFSSEPVISVFTTSSSTSFASSLQQQHLQQHRLYVLQRDGTLTRLKLDISPSACSMTVSVELKVNVLANPDELINNNNNNNFTEKISSSQLWITSAHYHYSAVLTNQRKKMYQQQQQKSGAAHCGGGSVLENTLMIYVVPKSNNNKNHDCKPYPITVKLPSE